MKRIFFFLFVCILYSIFFSFPSAVAEDLFEVSIIQCGDPGNPDGCGSNPAASDPLDYGEVKVDSDGTVRVLLSGAYPDTSYRVLVGNWINGNGFQYQYYGGSAYGSIGSVFTDPTGFYDGFVFTDEGTYFYFPAGTTIGQPNFVFNNPDEGPSQFTTGFSIQTNYPPTTDPPTTGYLPETIRANNVYITISAGTYDQGLTVNGNNFTLIGSAGDSCGTDVGWSIITEEVIINGNNAMFQNIKFLGPVIENGNNTSFVNCCFQF